MLMLMSKRIITESMSVIMLKIIFEIILHRLLDGCITVNDEDYAVETLLEGECEELK